MHFFEEDKLSNGMFELMLSTVVFEANMVNNLREWFIDPGTTHHVCALSYTSIHERNYSWKT